MNSYLWPCVCTCGFHLYSDTLFASSLGSVTDLEMPPVELEFYLSSTEAGVCQLLAPQANDWLDLKQGQ